MIPLDTAPEVAAMQREIHKRMGGEGRLRLALEMSEAVHEMALARLRRDHPDQSERDIVKLYLRRFFRPGEEIPPVLQIE